MRRPLVLASLVATLAIAPAIAGDTKEGLGWKFTKGEKARYGVAYNLEMKFEVMGMVQGVHQNARLEITQETKDVKDGVATVEATLDRVQIEVELPAMLGGGGKVAFDSDKKDEKKDEKKKDEKKKKSDDDDDDEGGPGAGGMGGMGLSKDAFNGLHDIVGSKFTFKIAKDGSVSDLEGVEEIAKKAVAKLGPGAGMAGGAAGAAFPLLDPEVLQQTLDLHCHVFPSGDAGDSWQVPSKIQLPAVGTMEFKRTITPKGEDKLVHTAGKPTLTPAKNPGAGNPMMPNIGKPTIKDPGYEGTSTISREKGRVTGDELTATVTSELSMDNPMGGGGKKGAMGGDDDDDDDAPKKKDDKKKDDKKKGDDDDDDDAPKGGAGGNKVKIVQKFKLVLKYDLLNGEKSAEKTEKKDEK